MSGAKYRADSTHEAIRCEVLALVAIYAADGESPQSINSGSCEDFACELQASLRAKAIIVDVVYTEDFEEVKDSGGHAWIRHQGRHFDAEASDGVESVSELPFFRREVRTEHTSRIINGRPC